MAGHGLDTWVPYAGLTGGDRMKCWNPLRNLSLCALGAWGVGLILCRMLGLSAADSLIPALVGGVCSFLAVLSLPRDQTTAGILLSIGVLFAAALGLFRFRAVLPLLCLIATALLTFGAVLLGNRGFYGPLGCWSVVLMTLATSLTPPSEPLWKTCVGLGALLSLGLTLDGFRDISLRRSHHLGRDASANSTSHLQASSLRLLLLFLAGALMAAAGILGLWSLISDGVQWLFHLLLTGTGAVGYGFSMVLKCIMDFFLWLLSLIPKLPEGGSSGGGTTYEKPVYTGGPGSPFSTLLLVIVTVVGCVAVAAVVGTAILRNKRPRSTAPELSDYVDEIERLERPKWKPFSHRKHTSRMRDYQGPMKIRFAFQQLLRSRKRDDPSAYTKTPNELRQEGRPDEDILINAYNRVRYGGLGVTDAELDAAERVVKQL